MAGKNLYWVEGPWVGRLALSARPRGGDWLEGEIVAWQRDGVDLVFSLLTKDEERDLDITLEGDEAQAHGMSFLSFPVLDREVPESQSEFARVLERLDGELSQGHNVVMHCRQGIGRTGLAAACLLMGRGISTQTALDRLSAARGTPVPETEEQRRWIFGYAERLGRVA